jgi:tetratricopeptide (TPR) repeat protein
MSWNKIIAVIISRLFPNSRRGLKERLRLDHEAAVTLYGQGSYDQARTKIDENFTLAEKLGEISFDRADYLDLAADFFHSTGNYSLSEEPARSSLRIREAIFGEDDPAISESLNNLGLLLYAQGRDDEAVNQFSRLVNILKKHSPQTRELAICLDNLAAALRRLDRSAEAEEATAKAAGIREKLK